MDKSRWKKLDQRTHVLKRPETYIGSVNLCEEEMFIISNPHDIKNPIIEKKVISYVPAFLKLFDEALVNALDASVRSGKVKNIDIEINKTDNSISIYNDGGGILIDKAEGENIYIPEMIFFHFLSGENFDDEVGNERVVGGRNGIGIKAVSVWSKEFHLETGDGKKIYTQKSKSNLEIIENPVIKKSNKEFVKIKFYPDLERFKMTEINDDVLGLLVKRIFDAAAYQPKVNITLNGVKVPVKTVKEYMTYHLPQGTDMYYEKLSNGWEIGIAKSTTDQMSIVSVVNGINVYNGGTHINYIANTLSKNVADSLAKKLKVQWTEVKNNLFVFMVGQVPNPTFTSQTKEQLTNYIGKEILGEAKISDKMVKWVLKSDIIQDILRKIALKEQLELKKIQSQKKKIEKLVDATGKDRKNCELFIFEGDSAGKPTRRFRNPQNQGFICLRGKFINVTKSTDKKILEDKDARNLMASLGLTLNEKPKKENLRYHKIVIATDADVDGDCITAQLLNFFSLWEDLFDWGMLYKVITPLLVIKKGKNKKFFYSMDEWNDYLSKNSLNGYEVSYKKGLGALEDEEFEEIIRNPKLIQFIKDGDVKSKLNVWFGDDAENRKNELI